MRKWYPIALIVLAYAAGIVVFGRLPERVATHFDGYGNPNGWTSRAVTVLLLPTIALLIWPILRFLPRIDPRRANYDKMQSTYDIVVNLALSVIVGVHLMLLGVALGMPIRIERVFPVMIGIVLVVIGNLLPRARPNWWFGIRTPWTLSSDRVWERTHRVGGYLMMAAGVVSIATVMLRPPLGGIVMGVAVGAMAVTAVAYSYFAWRDENRSRGDASASQT